MSGLVFRDVAQYLVTPDINEEPRRSAEVATFVGLCALALVTKLSSSVDDVAWLLPYMKARHRWLNAVVYVLLMLAVVGTSILFSICGKEAVEALVSDDGGWWTTERVLTVIAATLLACYTVYLFYDWYTGDDDDEEEDEDGDKSDQEASKEPKVAEEASPTAESSEDGDSVVVEVELKPGVEHIVIAEQAAAEEKQAELEATNEATQYQVEEDDKKAEEEDEKVATQKEPTTFSLITVALLGSLDDLSVFFGLLLSGTFNPYNLLVGVFLGSIVVVLICIGATFLRPVVWVIERIPLFVIIGLFTIWTVIGLFIDL